jgi:hypothetical protein
MKNKISPSAKKIGIVANYECLLQWDNYGTLFQNFALQTVLRSMDYDPFWIKTCSRRDLVSIHRKIYNKSLQFFFDPSDFKVLLNDFFIQRTSKSSLDPQIEQYDLFNITHPRFFEEFMEQYLQRSSDLYPVERVNDHFPSADAYIAGSDNVWGTVSDASFLNFGSPDIVRIGYSVSAPWSKLSNYWYHMARKKIQSFNALSTRELEGVEVCRKLGKDSAVQTLDPTLLLKKQDYLDVSASDEKILNLGPFILAYFVNLFSLSHLPWQDLCSLSIELHAELKVVPLQGAELVIPSDYVYTPSPSQWLKAYSFAQCIVTNSYHGTIFAILMEKPFIAIPQHHAPKNERIPNLLGMLGLKDRLYNTKHTIYTQMMKPINWNDVQSRLNTQRANSLEFLKNALALI